MSAADAAAARTTLGAAASAQEAWREIGASGQPTFQTNWSNYGSGSTAAFRVDSLGVVHLKGHVKRTVNAGGPIFGFPSGALGTYFPGYSLDFICATDTGSQTVTIANGDGNVYGVGTPGWLSLDGIQYRGNA